MTDQQKVDQIASHIKEILRIIGEDPEREGLLKTPVRSAKALMYITQGYAQSGRDTVRQAIFEYAGSKMIIVKDIEFYSMCEHHILPFFGKVSIGYVPDGEMVGISKLARLVNVFARRLQVQERFTAQLVDELSASLKTKGVIVACTAEHLCMKMRGVEKQGAATTTTDYNGVFAEDYRLREEFFQSLKH